MARMIMPGATEELTFQIPVLITDLTHIWVHFYHADGTEVFTYDENSQWGDSADTKNIYCVEGDPENMFRVFITVADSIKFEDRETAKVQLEFDYGVNHKISTAMRIRCGENFEQEVSE